MENYQNYVATPKLGFGEAVKKVLSNVTNIKGRSRRSEYWWYFLVVIVVNVVASMLFSGIPVVTNILSVIIALSMIAVTVRRLQDSGHSGIWVYIQFVCGLFLMIYLLMCGFYEASTSINPDPTKVFAPVQSPLFLIPALISTICGIVIFIFALQDSKIGPNKYGDSPKYIDESMKVNE